MQCTLCFQTLAWLMKNSSNKSISTEKFPRITNHIFILVLLIIVLHQFAVVQVVHHHVSVCILITVISEAITVHVLLAGVGHTLAVVQSAGGGGVVAAQLLVANPVAVLILAAEGPWPRPPRAAGTVTTYRGRGGHEEGMGVTLYVRALLCYGQCCKRSL